MNNPACRPKFRKKIMILNFNLVHVHLHSLPKKLYRNNAFNKFKNTNGTIIRTLRKMFNKEHLCSSTVSNYSGELKARKEEGQSRRRCQLNRTAEWKGNKWQSHCRALVFFTSQRPLSASTTCPFITSQYKGYKNKFVEPFTAM